MTHPATASSRAALLEEAQADPAGFRRRAERLRARHAGDPATSVHVRWATGLALRELGELGDARDELERAANDAAELGDATAAALIRSSLAVVRLHLGDASTALEETDRAGAQLQGIDAARNLMQRGLILQRLGRHDEAVAAYDRARPELEAAEDRAAEMRLLGNRGVLHAYRGELDAARWDLERSVTLARELEASRPIALALQNLGFVAGRQGDVPEALALFAEADELLEELGDTSARAVLDTDRAELLADAGLFDEALHRAEAAAHALADDEVNGSEAQLLLARMLLFAGHVDRAATLADELDDRFRSARRDAWGLQARYVALAARADGHRRAGSATSGRPRGILATEAAEVAGDLAAAGWVTEARAARLLAAQLATTEGRPDEAEEQLRRLRGATRDMPALARAQHWYAVAELRSRAGENGSARRAIAAGLAALDEARVSFGSAELRAYTATHTVRLVELAIRLALADGRAAEALRALDRVRATDVAVPARPPDDPRLAADLAELRRVVEAERSAARSGGDVGSAVADRARLEQRVRDRARALGAVDADPAAVRLEVGELRRRLHERTLVAYLELDGRLHVLEVTARATRHRELGPVAAVRAEVGYLRTAVRRLAHGQGSNASLAAATASFERSVTNLLELLGLDDLEGEDLVVVPTGVLDGLPWAALHSRLGSVPVVTPSARAWSAAADDGVEPRRDGPILVVAGPGLPGARAEVEQVARCHPGSRLLIDEQATVSQVLSGLERSTRAHLAAHGSFRADNPLFSTMRLADGALTVYELEQLSAVPELLVVSSCEAGAATTMRGDAVLGLSSVLLRMGVRTVIAPVVEIPDVAVRPLMTRMHERLAQGRSPRHALSDALGAIGSDPSTIAAGAAFAVHGHGG